MQLSRLVIGLLAASVYVDCLAAIGTITEQVNSPASIQRAKNQLPGVKGTGVEMDDAVKTSQGKVGITFADDTRVQVNENSRLVIDDFVYDPKSKTGKLALNMASGTVRYASGAIAHNSPAKVAINTPTATIAVRGTDFTATVDELGASTVILLPSCPNGFADVKKDCKVGVIDVITDAGSVTLDQAFQATKVESRSLPPTKPVTINLSLDAMNNLLILSPPNEIKRAQAEQTKTTVSLLSQDFLKEADLGNVLADQQKQIFQNRLAQNFLEQDFLANILTMLNEQLAADLKLLNSTNSGLLPDYRASTGIKAYVDDLSVTLYRDDGSNKESVTVNKNETATVYMTQGQYTFKNRINSGAGTTITVKQN
jgi:hypothetical protein